VSSGLDLDVDSGLTVGYLDLHLDLEDLTYDRIGLDSPAMLDGHVAWTDDNEKEKKRSPMWV